MSPVDLVIIGAGIAGIACAQRAAKAGARVVLLDKARGPGGRLSTRRVETAAGEARFDHGAQYFTVRDGSFAAALARLRAQGDIAAWPGRLVRIDASGGQSALPAEERFVGAPGMNALIKGLGDGLDIRFSAEAAELTPAGENWAVRDRDGALLAEARQVALAVPAPQAQNLLGPVCSLLAANAADAEMAPTWTLLAAFAARQELGFDGADFAAGPIAFAARQGSKPGRDGVEAWTLHASPAWTRAHLEWEAEEAAEALLAAARAVLPGLAAPIWRGAHRWRYAQVTRAPGSAYAYDRTRRLGACGDWRLGPRVELAWQSGDALGQAMMHH